MSQYKSKCCLTSVGNSLAAVTIFHDQVVTPECAPQCFPGQEVDVRYDYELLPSRRPKFLAQTAAHVSGAAFYYQKSDVSDQPWAEKVTLLINKESKLQLCFNFCLLTYFSISLCCLQKMYGVCVHPRFGGWFAIRALLIFKGVTVGSEMVQPVPPDCVRSREDRIKLLEAFNFHWQVQNLSTVCHNSFDTHTTKRHMGMQSVLCQRPSDGWPLDERPPPPPSCGGFVVLPCGPLLQKSKILDVSSVCSAVGFGIRTKRLI